MRHTRVLGAVIPPQFLPNFSNMLLLALPQIYTRVFHLSKSVALNNAWNGDFRPFKFFPLACFRAFRDAPHSRF